MAAQVTEPHALLTGCAGFVGRHMRAALVDAGYRVYGIDLNYGTGVDVRDFWRDPHGMANVVHWDLVVHCAAVVGGRTMIEGSPLALAAEDLSIDAELFRWALRRRPGRIVYFSSSAAYPVHLQSGQRFYSSLVEGDIDLNRPKLPDQTYGWVKLTGERLAAEANAAGIPTYVFRPFSGYGSDQALDYPFPAIIDRAVRREDPLTIWSNTVRDFVHIDDVVGCVMAALEAGDVGPMSICTGRATSFSELARMAAECVGYHAEVKVLYDKPTGVQHRVGWPNRMMRVYRPCVTLEDGIARAVAAREASCPS